MDEKVNKTVGAKNKNIELKLIECSVLCDLGRSCEIGESSGLTPPDKNKRMTAAEVLAMKCANENILAEFEVNKNAVLH